MTDNVASTRQYQIHSPKAEFTANTVEPSDLYSPTLALLKGYRKEDRFGLKLNGVTLNAYSGIRVKKAKFK